MRMIHIVRKPIKNGVADNVLAHETAGLNIQASRIAFVDDVNMEARQIRFDGMGYAKNRNPAYGDVGTYKPGGRWPANAMLTLVGAEEIDFQSGLTVSQGGPIHQSGSSWKCASQSETYARIQDGGGASRFFKVFG